MPFGLDRNSSGQTVTSYKFTDQEMDEESGLYNYDARLYDPAIGRFISPDPTIPQPFNPQSLNRYSYCLNNPLIYIDPSGYDYTCGDDGHWNDDGSYTTGECEYTEESGGAGSMENETGEGPPEYGSPEWFEDIENRRYAEDYAPDIGETNSHSNPDTGQSTGVGGVDSVTASNPSNYIKVDNQSTIKSSHNVDEKSNGSIRRGTVYNSGVFLRTFIPGQIRWDNTRTDFSQGNYRGAVLNTTAMIGEQVLTVLTVGQGSIIAQSGERATQSGIRYLFGKGGVLNSGHPNLRIGFGRSGGNRVFRISGNWVKALPKSWHDNGHIVLKDLGLLKKKP